MPQTCPAQLADLLAAKLNAPNRLPAGAQDLDNPFLQEAYARAFDHFHRSEHDNARQLYHYILNQSPTTPGRSIGWAF